MIHGCRRTALVVKRIFALDLSGLGIFAIAERLTRDAIPSPSAADPGRNRHRTGEGWAKSAVKAILANPRYTGRQVWNKQRKDEVLLDGPRHKGDAAFGAGCADLTDPPTRAVGAAAWPARGERRRRRVSAPSSTQRRGSGPDRLLRNNVVQLNG